MKLTPQQLNAQLYDCSVSDWPGEIKFYRQLIANSGLEANGVLEIACGTGRVTVPLAKDGVSVTGLDRSAELLGTARAKSVDLQNVNWAQDDMRRFDLGRQFGIVIIPGHSFQFMNTPEDQVRCLKCIQQHLIPNGILVLHLDHQDVSWLGDLVSQKQPAETKGKLLTHPVTGQTFRQSYHWTYERSSQTATVHLTWEQMSAEGKVIDTWEMDPMPLHCAFRFEIEHLLLRMGFAIEALYGDFTNAPLTSASEQMVWVARNFYD